MAFRTLDQNPVYLGTDGITPCAGGTITTFTNLTTTPLATYADTALSVSNGVSITLDSTGRAPVEIWSSATFRMLLKNAAGTTVWTRDNCTGGSGLPALISGGFINSVDGTTLVSSTIRQLPDPTGNAGKFVGTSDGVNATYITIPTLSAGAGAALTNFVATNVREKVQTVAATATLAIDYSAGGIVKLTQNVSITALTLTGTTNGDGCVLTIMRFHDASASAWTIAWPASVKWPGHVAPNLTQTTGARDDFTLVSIDGGTTWSGTYSLDQG
jgi:hypothetical protein